MNRTAARSTRSLWLTVALIVLASAALATLRPAGTSAAAEDRRTNLVMLEPRAGAQGTLLLAAKLTDPRGNPIEGASIDFFFLVDFMGESRAPLGSAVTTDAGIARVPYRVRLNGPVDFGATFDGTPDRAAAVGGPVRVIMTTGRATLGIPEENSLGRVGRWVPWVALVLALAVWGTLIGVTARTVIGLQMAARGYVPQPGVAVPAGQGADEGKTD